MDNIKKVLAQICNADISQWQNERYLHHYFSQQMQKFYPVEMGKMHPEWATHGKYREVDKKYQLCANGTKGHIDFAFGNYNHPSVAVEFKLMDSWNGEGIVFDFMKLMHSDNPIDNAISFSIIKRTKSLSATLHSAIDNRLAEFKKRLGSNLAKNRPFLFVIAEIDSNKNKRFWSLNDISKEFEVFPDNQNPSLSLQP
jgi:hypothetical protein